LPVGVATTKFVPFGPVEGALAEQAVDHFGVALGPERQPAAQGQVRLRLRLEALSLPIAVVINGTERVAVAGGTGFIQDALVIDAQVNLPVAFGVGVGLLALLLAVPLGLVLGEDGRGVEQARSDVARPSWALRGACCR